MKTITRKEIANANNISEPTMRRREKSLGLSECRDRACDRPIRYYADKAAEKLKRNGWNSP